MPEVVVKFITDNSALKDSVKELENMGKVTEMDVATFKKLSAESEAAGNKIKVTYGTQDQLKKSVAETVTVAEKLRKSLVDGSQQATEQVKTLRTQILEAKNAAAAFADQNSAGAIAAQKNVANLIEKQDDLNKRVQALNPEARFQAFTQVTQGALGSLQVLTGAMQAFGIENEEVQKMAQKLQGVLNLSQGINSILGLKDALGNLKVALGITTVAQSALATATTAEGVAATGAAAANYTFAASLSATGIGAIIVLLGVLVAAMIEYDKSVKAATTATEKQNEAFKKQLELMDLVAGGFLDVLDADKKLQAFELEKATLLGASEKEILELKLKHLQANKDTLEFSRAYVEDSKELAKVNNQILDINNEIALAQLRIDKAVSETIERSKGATKIELLDDLPTIEKKTKDALDVIAREIKSNTEIFDVARTNATDLNKAFFGQQDELQQKSQDAIEQSFSDVQGITSAHFDFVNALSEASSREQISQLQQQRDAGIISEQQYQSAVKKIKQEAAVRQKAEAIFEATLNFSLALIRALAKEGPAGAAAAAIIAGINLARIIATPIPKFKHGTLSVAGVNTGGDSVHAMLQPGEAVIPTDINKAYSPSITAIYKGLISPKELNAYVQNKTSGRKEAVEATFNPYSFKRVMKGMPMIVANAKQIGKAVADELGGSSRVTQKRLA